jgi:Zn-dependent protease/CBS domain-containing protein
MGRDIPMGRIFGVKVGMNVTVLFVAALYAWLLADNRFPHQVPGLSTTAYWVAGVAGALVFFLSLLVHEIGHALVAKDEGIGVRGISLWLLGGVARLESSPSTPRAEFRIAVVGPLASAACGALLLSIAYVLPDRGYWALAGEACSWFGIINLLLAAFNILPAAPLDGGTVLSSILWWRTGSRSTGMQWAARSGILVGAAIAYAGIRGMRGANGDIDIWFVMVGGFIAVNAWQQLRVAPLYQLLDGTTVAQAMYPAPPTGLESMSVADLLRSLPRDTHHQAYPILGSHGRVIGLLTASAIRAVPSDQWERLRVVDLAYPLDRVSVVRTDEPLMEAVQKVDGGDVRVGLVVDPTGRMVGTIDADALYQVAEARRAQLSAT